MPTIKLFQNNEQVEPDHEFDTEDMTTLYGGIILVAQTGKHYTMGHRISGGTDSYAFYEAEVTTVNFTLKG